MMNCPSCDSGNTANVVQRLSTLFSCAFCLEAAEIFHVLPEYPDPFGFECPLA